MTIVDACVNDFTIATTGFCAHVFVLLDQDCGNCRGGTIVLLEAAGDG